MLSDFDYVCTNATQFSFYAFSLAYEHDTFCAELLLNYLPGFLQNTQSSAIV